MKNILIYIYFFLNLISCIESEKKQLEIDSKRPVPPLPPNGHLVNDSIAEKLKMQQEIERLQRDTKIMVKREYSSIKPGFNKYHFNELEKTENVCSSINFENLKFDQQFVENHPYYHDNSYESYGKIFCIGEFVNKENRQILKYGKNQDGHHDDIVYLELINPDLDSIISLVLFSHFGKDGYDMKIESEFAKDLITRIIHEEFGWLDNPYKPICRTKQIFKIDKSGNLNLIKQIIENKNID